MLPHWPRGRVGLGDTIQDQLEAQALATPQWSTVAAQVNSEIDTSTPMGALRLTAVKGTFVNAFSSLVTPANGFGDVIPEDALNAAAQITTIGQTALGAANTISGLVHDIDTGNTAAILQTGQEFAAGMIALAVGAGAVSAGIGAAIVAGVGALIQVLQGAGFFSPPPGVQINGCGGAYYNPPPNVVVGCVAGICDSGVPPQVKPGSGIGYWRPFPKKGSDAQWFVQQTPQIHYGGVTWSIPPLSIGANGLVNPRPIDIAFPNYAWVERGATAQPGHPPVALFISGSPFLQGFASAWCANAEYALNGLKAQDDAQVLAQFLRIWNRAHVGAPVTMYQGGNGSYAESLVTATRYADSTYATRDGGLSVNTGQALKASDLARSPAAMQLVTASVTPSSGLSTGATIAAGVAVAGGAVLVGSAAYAAYKHESLKNVWAQLLRRAKFW